MKTCSNCGAQNRDDATFCFNCGQRLPDSPLAPTMILPVEQSTPPPGSYSSTFVTPPTAPPPAKGRTWAWAAGGGCGALALLACLAVGGYFAYQQFAGDGSVPGLAASPTATLPAPPPVNPPQLDTAATQRSRSLTQTAAVPPTRPPTLTPTVSASDTQIPTATATDTARPSPRPGPSATQAVSNVGKFKASLNDLYSSTKALGSLNDSDFVNCRSFVDTYNHIISEPSYTLTGADAATQDAYSRYQQAIAIVRDTSRDEKMFCDSALAGVETSYYIPFQHWGLSRQGVDNALTTLRPAMTEMGLTP